MCRRLRITPGVIYADSVAPRPLGTANAMHPGMPRRLFGDTGGVIFHVMNRGDHGQVLFHTPADFDAFIGIVREALARVDVPMLDYSVMKTHWHFVLWPRNHGDLTRFIGWLSLTHACRWQRAHGTRGMGPVYQGRFKAVPIESDGHVLIACAYVERNPVRAGYVKDARDWRWCGACDSGDPSALRLSPWPVARPADWLERINRPEPPADLERVRMAVAASSPFGSEAWCAATIERLGWTSGVRPAGRPRAAGRSRRF
jgi:putative transposase